MESISTLDVAHKGSWAFVAHGEYILMFNNYIGLGMGLDLSHLGDRTSINGQMQWNGVIDTDGEGYNHHLTISQWHDNQDVWYLQPEVFVHASVPVSTNLTIILAAGLEIGVRWIFPHPSKRTNICRCLDVYR